MPTPGTLMSLRTIWCVLVGLSIGAAVVRADTFTITTSNFAGTGSFGTITTTLVSNAIEVNVELAPGWIIHGAGVGLNVVDPDAGVTLSSFSAHYSTGPANHQFDGFGRFEFSAASDETPSSARAHGTNTARFTVSRTGGFSSASQLSELNSAGWIFAIQAAPTDPNLATGFFAARVGATPTAQTTWGRIKSLYR
jgi:hypothetical protein